MHNRSSRTHLYLLLQACDGGCIRFTLLLRSSHLLLQPLPQRRQLVRRSLGRCTSLRHGRALLLSHTPDTLQCLRAKQVGFLANGCDARSDQGGVEFHNPTPYLCAQALVGASYHHAPANICVHGHACRCLPGNALTI